MNIDLPAMVKRAHPTRRAAYEFATFDPTVALQRRLAVIYSAVPRAWASVARETILPAYGREIAADGLTRDDAASLNRAVDDAVEEVVRIVVGLTAGMAAGVGAAELWHRRRFAWSIRSATGVDLDLLLGTEEARDAMEAAFRRNMSLVRSISEDTRQRIADAVWRGYQAGTPRRMIAREFGEAVALSRARSLRIAVDQTTKLAATLDDLRQAEIGLTHWKWRHSRKAHPRAHHVARDGKIYRRGRDGLGGDLPGVAPFCGCKMQAVLTPED